MNKHVCAWETCANCYNFITFATALGFAWLAFWTVVSYRLFKGIIKDKTTTLPAKMFEIFLVIGFLVVQIVQFLR